MHCTLLGQGEVSEQKQGHDLGLSVLIILTKPSQTLYTCICKDELK